MALITVSCAASLGMCCSAMLGRVSRPNSVFLLWMQCSSVDRRSSPTPSVVSSRCSELSFCNEDYTSTDNDTSTPLPTSPLESSKLMNCTSTNGAKSIDMGDYELRIRPASAFWCLPDGLTMAEKILIYRNWKYCVSSNTSLQISL